jgi:prepilin-type N-terminal cleavage/methylation domain-containing protein
VSRRPTGFTLIELLVVLAILVLVAGIVFAAFGPAREKGRQAVCASNLRQIHHALMMYAADYGGGEPEGARTYSELGLPPPISFDRYGNGGPLTEQYLGDARLWICPNDPCTFMVKLHPECRADPRRCCISYVTALWWDGNTPGVGPFPGAVAQCGQRLPLYYCPWHGLSQNVSTYVLVLRWSGQVQGRYMRLPRTPCLD